MRDHKYKEEGAGEVGEEGRGVESENITELRGKNTQHEACQAHTPQKFSL